jgi:hypothetical protein
MGGACGTHGIDKMINSFTVLVGNPELKRPFGTLRRRWENGIINGS